MQETHPTFDPDLERSANEAILAQTARAVWLYGLSGSGKTTLAVGLAERLRAEKRVVRILDGDGVRLGLNRDLGFSDADREENIRRVAEVAKLFVDSGVIVISSFITPRNRLRAMAREIIGAQDFIEVYLECSYETCLRRDVKGLYARAEAGLVKDFTGRDSSFEPPLAPPDLAIDTETQDVQSSLTALHDFVRPRIARPPAR
ncbi:MAG: adenylyl-sulfate kinase [Planctomycetes bacterium]|nr:adenylyl-sulfate kinase [Planctomycetota bacterium]